jgi:hypothetical protein
VDNDSAASYWYVRLPQASNFRVNLQIIFLERKTSTRYHVDYSRYFKHFTLLWKTCLFNGFTVQHIEVYALQVHSFQRVDHSRYLIRMLAF